MMAIVIKGDVVRSGTKAKTRHGRLRAVTGGTAVNALKTERCVRLKLLV